MAASEKHGLAVAFELFEAGRLMREARFRREHPDWSQQQVADAVSAWLCERPGAPHGDSAGRPGSLARFSRD